jgi:hypothetical protein
MPGVLLLQLKSKIRVSLLATLSLSCLFVTVRVIGQSREACPISKDNDLVEAVFRYQVESAHTGETMEAVSLCLWCGPW